MIWVPSLVVVQVEVSSLLLEKRKEEKKSNQSVVQLLISFHRFCQRSHFHIKEEKITGSYAMCYGQG